MGFKSLSLQMIPWCFHVMGSGAGRPSDHRTSPAPPAQEASVRLIGVDGKVRVYHRPVAAAELMKEHPCHLVCRSDAFYIGQKVPPLAAGDHLQPGHAYFLLPSQFFHSVLSFVTLAASLLGTNSSGRGSTGAVNGAGPGITKKTSLLRPFDIHKTAAGAIQIRVSDEFLVEKLREDERPSSRVVTSELLEKEYSALVAPAKSRQWRPKLETIRESSENRRKRRGVVGNLGVFRRRMKKEGKDNKKL